MKFIQKTILCFALFGLATTANAAWTWQSDIVMPINGTPRVHSSATLPSGDWTTVDRVRCVAKIYEQGSIANTKIIDKNRSGTGYVFCLAVAYDHSPTSGCNYCDGDNYLNNRSNGQLWDDDFGVLAAIDGTLYRGYLFCDVWDESEED